MNQALALALAASLAAAACRSPEPGYSGADLPPRPRAAAEPAGEAGLAPAAEAVHAPEAQDEGWTLVLKPYLFAAGMSGTAVLADDATEVDADFSDLLGSLDFGGMLGLELAPSDSKVRLLADLIYVSLEEQGSSPAAGIENVDAQFDQLIAELTAAVELQPQGQVDLLLGLRYWSLDGDLSAKATPPGDDVSVSRSVSWLEPLIGVRSRIPLAGDLAVLVRADFAGFGLGSEYTYNLGGLLGWSVSDSLELALGYRHLFTKYDDDGFLYEVATAGPIVGLAWSL